MLASEPVGYVEVPRVPGRDPAIVGSTVRPATDAEIERQETLYRQGKCLHTVIKDKDVWPWFHRYCVTCGKLVGVL